MRTLHYADSAWPGLPVKQESTSTSKGDPLNTQTTYHRFQLATLTISTSSDARSQPSIVLHLEHTELEWDFFAQLTAPEARDLARMITAGQTAIDNEGPPGSPLHPAWCAGHDGRDDGDHEDCAGITHTVCYQRTWVDVYPLRNEAGTDGLHVNFRHREEDETFLLRLSSAEEATALADALTRAADTLYGPSSTETRTSATANASDLDSWLPHLDLEDGIRCDRCGKHAQGMWAMLIDDTPNQLLITLCTPHKQKYESYVSRGVFTLPDHGSPLAAEAVTWKAFQIRELPENARNLESAATSDDTSHPCPPWCDHKRNHPWEPDGKGWTRMHTRRSRVGKASIDQVESADYDDQGNLHIGTGPATFYLEGPGNTTESISLPHLRAAVTSARALLELTDLVEELSTQ